MIACHYLDPVFNLLLFGLALTVVALLGVLLLLALKWPKERRHPCSCGGHTTVKSNGRRWGWHRGSCPRVGEPFECGPIWAKPTAEPRVEDRPTGSPGKEGEF